MPAGEKAGTPRRRQRGGTARTSACNNMGAAGTPSGPHPLYNDELPSPTARLDSLVALAGRVGDLIDVDEDESVLGPTSAGGKRQLAKMRSSDYEGVALFERQGASTTAGLRSDNRGRDTGSSAAASKPSTRGTAKSSKAATSHPPPIPAKSPPLTPTAAAAAAAAAAARAECKTFLSGEQEATDKDKSGRTLRRGSTRGTRSTAKAGAQAVDEEEESTAGPEAEDPAELDEYKDASRRSSRRRSANSRFEPYHTKGLDLSPKPSPSGHRKRAPIGSVLDHEVKLESVLARLAHTHGANHPEMGKVLLQLARVYFAAGRQEKAEHYLKRSWDVYKAHAGISSNMQDVFDSFQLLFEDYNCSPQGLDSLRRDMFVLSPPRGQDLKMSGAWASIPTPRSMDINDSISEPMVW